MWFLALVWVLCAEFVDGTATAIGYPRPIGYTRRGTPVYPIAGGSITFTLGATLGDTSDAASYTTGSFTPAANDLVIVFIAVTGDSSTSWAVSDSVGGTYTKIRRQVNATPFMEVWVADALAANTSRTITVSRTSGTANGCAIVVERAAGMTQAGASAVRSQGGQDAQGSGTTPAPALNQAALSANAILTAVLNNTNSAGGGNTSPTGYSALNTGRYGTPATALAVCGLQSGSTATTITWGGTSPSAFCSVAIELDATKYKSLAGGVTPTGAVGKQDQKALGGGATPDGTVAKQDQKPLGGGTTPTGAIAKQDQKAMAGAETPSGALGKMPGKLLAGAEVPTSTMVRTSGKGLGGDLTPVGAPAKDVGAFYGGDLEPDGNPAKLISKPLAGALEPSGLLSRLVGKFVSGVLEPLGDLALDFISGTHDFFVSLAGSLEPIGDLFKMTAKPLSGAAEPEGDLIRTSNKGLGGSLDPASVVSKRVSKSLDGSIEPTGDVALFRVLLLFLAGVLSPEGSLSKLVGKQLGGEMQSDSDHWGVA